MRRPWVTKILARGRMLLDGSRDASGQIQSRTPRGPATGSSADAAPGFESGALAGDGSDVNIGDAFPREQSRALDFDAAVLNQALPQYEILETLDRGGQGIVYRALQRSTGRVVALKVLHPDAGGSGRRVQRFAREVELVARLRHPHVVTVFDSGVAAGRPYLSMELIDGLSIDDFVLVNRPTVRDCVVLFEKICRAVASVHQRGVIHRDLKPSNIRVDLEGEPHILDFGLAKCADDEPGDQSVSVAGQVVGTLPFLSPEQITGADGGVDIRTDIYALGVILHLLLTGEMPYAIEGPREKVAANILGKIPERLDRRDREQDESGAAGPIPSDLSHVVLKALAKEKSRRYQSADAFADDLRRFLDGGAIAARGDGFGYLVRVAWRKYRMHSMVAAAFVFLLAGSTIGMGVLWQRSERMAKDGTYSRALSAGVRSASNRRDKGQIEEAIRFSEQAIEFGRKIVFPTVDDNRAMYAVYHDLSQIYLEMPEKIDRSRIYCDAACQIAESLIRQEPGESEYRRLLAFARRLQGRITQLHADWETAALQFSESAELFQSLPRSESEYGNAPVDFETLFSKQYLGKAHLKLNDRTLGLKILREVAEKLEQICILHPTSMDYRLELARTEALIAKGLIADKSQESDIAALSLLKKSLGRLDSAFQSGMAESRFMAARKLSNSISEHINFVTDRIDERQLPVSFDYPGSSSPSGKSAGSSSSSSIGSGASDR